MELESYDWTGRTVEYHRAQIQEHLGFRECSVADAAKLTAYLAGHVADTERRPEQVRVELLPRCREESIEPPTPGRCDRIVAAALRAAEESLTALISSRLTAESIERIMALVAGGADQDDVVPAGGGTEGEDAPPVLAKVKEAPGNVSLETMLTEIDKLLAVRAIGLPRDLFIDVAEGRGGLAGAGCGGVAFPSADAPGGAAGDLAGRAAARAGAGDHRHAGGAADLHGAPDRGAGGEEGHRAADQCVQEGVGQGSSSSSPRRRSAPRRGQSGRSCSRRCPGARRRCGSWCTSSRPGGRSTGARCRRR